MTAALRRAQAATLLEHPRRELRAGPVVLLLTPALAVQGQTPQTSEYLRILLPAAPGAPPVPAAAYNVAAQLLAVESGTDTHQPVARVHLSEGHWLTVRADRLAADAAAEQPPIAVTIETASTAERLDLFTRAFGLSPRESELLGHLAAGTRHQGDRGADVPVRIHDPGPPEGDLGQDRRPHPPRADQLDHGQLNEVPRNRLEP